MRADVVVDASGRNTPFPDWLRAEGATVTEEESPAGILYFTRHYKLRDGAEEPVRDGTPGPAILATSSSACFRRDNRHFSITLAVPEIETDLRMAIVKPDIFDAICMEIPGCARWVDPARSEPASQVFSMGNLQSVWRQLCECRPAAGAELLRRRRCGGAHQSALWPRLLGRRGACASAARQIDWIPATIRARARACSIADTRKDAAPVL